MSKVSGIGVANPASRISEVGRSAPQQQTTPVSFNERFAFPAIEMEDGSTGGIALEDRVYREVLISLFVKIHEEGIDIVPKPPSDHGAYIVEASFRPAKDKYSKPTMILPLRGVARDIFVARRGGGVIDISTKEDLIRYIDKILMSSSDEQILRLLVVASHELGHYLSFVCGNHDRDLSTGLYLFHNKQVNTAGSDKFTWLVFREECTAWSFAYDVLSRGGFDTWKVFNDVKYNSLSTYYTSLNLAKASIDTYCKLNLLGDDFFRSVPKTIFNELE